ncbi:hypothetical protein EF847_01410 [Actinobacteria bacterium YIM 96077]|uniref:Uncharacterized protein n=1 Tax=Phytoactinopolyspora halophila TaxID=1981511 RepID=A0A329QF94_9ACTN|nr:hypothetical protein EF847_01410 [Actinobacteria bacterium YIM 96077]RAW11125.1 hypothetical protein DPM12_17435 [Phytoactinopolyspora halophila]
MFADARDVWGEVVEKEDGEPVILWDGLPDGRTSLFIQRGAPWEYAEDFENAMEANGLKWEIERRVEDDHATS